MPDKQQADSQDRLWTPWRMRYVAGKASETGCIFCDRLAAGDDRQALILHRAEHAFVIMNLYPYNTGHTMLVPCQHTPSPEEADPAGMAAISQLRRPLLRALRRALNCHGFNLGVNIGDVAGAGLADHLHEHVVPRWTGDANFMPILAHTMVMPELVPVTYAKLRAELNVELAETTEAGCVLFTSDRQQVLVDRDGRAPGIPIAAGDPVWRTAAGALTALCGTRADLVGWAGNGRADEPAIELEFRLDEPAAEVPAVARGWQWARVPDALNPAVDPLFAAHAQYP